MKRSWSQPIKQIVSVKSDIRSWDLSGIGLCPVLPLNMHVLSQTFYEYNIYFAVKVNNPCLAEPCPSGTECVAKGTAYSCKCVGSNCPEESGT